MFIIRLNSHAKTSNTATKGSGSLGVVVNFQ